MERVEFSPVLPESIPKPWEKGRQYWAYDLVSYEGKYYECWASYEKTPGSGSGTIGKFEPIDFSITVLAAYDMDRSFTFHGKRSGPFSSLPILNWWTKLKRAAQTTPIHNSPTD
ncbi:MAG: hypothetical protein WDO14_22120 [Bacteroidota bacterium]